MTDHVRICFERELPPQRVLDPFDDSTHELEAPVVSIEARHAMSRTFRVDVELEVDIHEPIGTAGQRGIDLDLAALVDRRAVVDLGCSSDQPLVYHGIVTAAELVAIRDHRTIYAVTLRPALTRLRERVDTRIFQHLAVPQIVADVIAPSGQAIDLHLSGAYPARDYVVQHQETDFAFVSRLLEEEGIFYWFEHEPTRHVLHLADSRDAHRAADGPATLRFYADRAGHEDELSDIRFRTRVVHDAHVTRDWDWLRPNAPLEGAHTAGPARFERYEYPGRLVDEADARRRARIRHEEADARKYELSGVARNERIVAGRTFTLVDARPHEMNQDYLVTAVVHRFRPREAASVAPVELRAIPASHAFRPPRRTPRPRVSGRETAFVTGPGSEEIYVDELARIKALFYWDREGARDDRSSTWMRVAQPNTAGSMYLPRVGWEVAVAYVDGDPDRPLVTHRLYNEAHPPPYVLPEALSYTAWQSLSSPGGGGTNELRFDDTLGAMELYLHAQRDLHVRVGHDRSEAVGIHSREEVDGKLDTSVGLTETITVGVDRVTRVEQRMRAATGATKTISVAHVDAWNVRENHSITNDGNRTETIVGPFVNVAKDTTHTVHGDRSRTIGGALLVRVGGAVMEVVGQSKEETVSGARASMVRGAFAENIGGSKTLAAQRGTLTTAGSFSLTGTDVDTQVGGSVTWSVGENLGVSGSDVTVQGSSELRARAGGAELVLAGSVLDVDASTLSSAAALVRLLGQIELIGGDSADDAEPDPPGPEDDWIEIQLLDADGQPVGDARYVLRLPDGSERTGRLGGDGRARVSGIPPGTVLVSFPDHASTEGGA